MAAQAGRLLKWEQASLIRLLRRLFGGSASLPAGWSLLPRSPQLAPSDAGPGEWEEAYGRCAPGEQRLCSAGLTSEDRLLCGDMVPYSCRAPGPGGGECEGSRQAAIPEGVPPSGSSPAASVGLK